MIAHALALVIAYNAGGVVQDFARQITHETRPVRITGACASACTMWLGAKDVCVTPDAWFMFHQAYVDDKRHHRHLPNGPGTDMMEQYWPPEVRRVIDAVGGPPAEPRELWMSGKTLIELGVKRCL